MPTRPPTDAQLRHARRQRDQRYNAERRAVRGPDPRSTQRWRRVRAQVLAEEPLCRDPYGTHAAQGRVEPSVEVDHIIGLWDNPGLCFVRENLQPICTSCHARKSQEERRNG